MNFYKEQKWQHKRKIILRRDEYMCQECKRYGKTTPATTVHHINPLDQHPEWALLSWNLISLCGMCHDSMHDRITGMLTVKGLGWVDRVSPHLEAKK